MKLGANYPYFCVAKMKTMRKHHLRKPHLATDPKLDYIILGVIMLLAAVLRLWRLGQVPFMHDEFSALLRTRFDNFNDFVQQGIMPDSHPVGVEAFLWLWVRVFGWSELWVKLPFALMGIGSVYLIYLIGQQWFNRKVGLFSAAFFAVSQFTVFYSQLARPYAAGLFFVLLMAWFWYKIVFQVEAPKTRVFVGFALSAWACSLIQYFSIAQAGLIFLTGLFFLPRERRKAYWLSGVGAVLLFAPTLPIFYQQLFVSGSIGGWLSAPKSDYLLDFIQYTMNYDMLFMFAVGVIILLPLILGRRDKQNNPLRWAGLAWFVIIFAIAFTYSLLREPILQQSTLIFSYPFVVIVAFSLFKSRTLSPAQTALVAGVILFVGCTSLIMTRRHYDLMYHQGFDQIAVEMKADREQYGDSIQFATKTEIGEAAEFYQAPLGIDERVVFSRIYTEEGDFVREPELSDFNHWLGAHHETPMLGFGWTDYANPLWETTAVGNYPYILRQKDWFTSRYLTLSREPVEGSRYALTPLSDTPTPFMEWQEWGQAVTFSCDSLPDDVEALGIVAHIHNELDVSSVKLVVELHDAETDTIVLWHSSQGEDGCFAPGNHVIADAILFGEDFSPKGKTLRAYLWNEGHSPFVLNGISYYCTRKDPVLTGLYEPLHQKKWTEYGAEKQK